MIPNYSIKTFEAIEKKWDQFVYDHPNGNIFQTSHMFKIYKNTKNYEPISLAVVNKDDEIIALLLAALIREINGPLGNFSTHSRINGGILNIGGKEGFDAFSMLIEHYDKIVRRKAICSEFRNMWETSQIKTSLHNTGYCYEGHLNYLVDLSKSEKDLWNGLNKSGRRSVRMAIKNGLTIEEMEDDDQLPIFYNMLQDTYKNAKIPLADISFFKSAFHILTPQNMLKFFLVNYKDEYIGGMMVPMFKGILYELYVSSNKAYSKLYPSEFITWHLIKWGSHNGYHTFDFMGAGKPDKKYGVRDFKSKFGGNLVNFGRYVKVHSKYKMRIAKKGLQIYKILHIHENS